MAPRAKAAPKRGAAKGTIKVSPKSGLADKGVVLKDGGETYNAELQMIDPAHNHKKFYHMQVVESKDKSKYWFFQHWGRIGTTGQMQVKGPMNKAAAIKMIMSKFRQKAGVKFEDRGVGGAAAPGSTATTGKYEMMDLRLKKAKAGRATKKGAVAISLMWDNTNAKKTNDLDLHVTPPSGEKIWYMHKKSKCKGALDVDRQQDCKEPIENVVWKANAPKGNYTVQVVNYSCNHKNAVKFDVGICLDGGETQMMSKSVAGKDGAKTLVKKFKY